MEQTPRPARVDIPNHTNYQPEQEMFRLRQRLGDLMRVGAATPETFQQAIQQMWQETEKRRQSCLHEAEEHLRKYHALNAQAHGFSSMASIMWSVINGYVELEEKRNRELAEREREKAEQQEEELKAEGSTEEAPVPVVEGKTNGKRKRT